MQGTGPGLFSEQELQRLLRIEFERAQRYRYPLVCLLIAIDRLDRIQDLYGHEFKAELLRAVQSLLRQTVRESDLVGGVIQDRLLVLVTHTPPEGARAMADRLLDGARRLRFQVGPRAVRLTLSIGGAHNQFYSNLFFDTLVEVAEGGLTVAQSAGGDRYVHTELYAFFQEKHERERRARGESIDALPAEVEPPRPGMAPAPEPARPVSVPQERPPDVLRNLVAEEGGKALESARKAQDALSDAIRDMQARGGTGDISAELETYKRQIDVLERRISKLTQLLSMTEDELRRLIDAKSIDPGVASIYKNVQGLTDEAANRELKKALMARIFQANLELKQQLSSGN